MERMKPEQRICKTLQRINIIFFQRSFLLLQTILLQSEWPFEVWKRKIVPHIVNVL